MSSLPLSAEPLLLCLALAVIGVLASLKVLAVWVRQEQGVHDLKVRTHQLRNEVNRQAAQREGLIPYDDDCGVEVLEDGDDLTELIEAVPIEDEAVAQAA
ncbi:MAG: hypothetical protein KAS72_11955 [Phycisphaerales bacterium]|nr:hypothetical protein [Phycisphaerales bacterium]